MPPIRLSEVCLLWFTMSITLLWKPASVIDGDVLPGCPSKVPIPYSGREGKNKVNKKNLNYLTCLWCNCFSSPLGAGVHFMSFPFKRHQHSPQVISQHSNWGHVNAFSFVLHWHYFGQNTGKFKNNMNTYRKSVGGNCAFIYEKLFSRNSEVEFCRYQHNHPQLNRLKFVLRERTLKCLISLYYG